MATNNKKCVSIARPLRARKDDPKAAQGEEKQDEEGPRHEKDQSGRGGREEGIF